MGAVPHRRLAFSSGPTMGAVPHGCTASHAAVRHAVLARRPILRADVVLLAASSTSPSTRGRSSPSVRLHRHVPCPTCSISCPTCRSPLAACTSPGRRSGS
eukprot:5270776-Heterocapsa_arctica.AAC.1